jgi:uncharacterized protein YndB with AHSA1/START domain
MDTVEREVIVPAPPDEVWPALTDPEQLSAWFGADAELEVRPGGRGAFRWPDGSERRAVVEAVEPAHRLAFRWLPFQRTAAGAMVAVPSTRVEITLESVPGGTRVRVRERSAFALSGSALRSSRGALASIAS